VLLASFRRGSWEGLQASQEVVNKIKDVIDKKIHAKYYNF
jgi:hypothetical protein